MPYQWLADAVVVVHLGFLVFLATGSLLAWRWPNLVWLHLPSVAWGLVSISAGVACPLTALEEHFRALGGEQGRGGGFVDHYIEGVVYPERFTPVLRLLIAAAVVAGYAGMVLRARRRVPATTAGDTAGLVA